MKPLLLLFIILNLFINSAFAANHLLRLGIPKKHPAPIYKLIKSELNKRGFREGDNLQIKEFDLKRVSREDIESSVDMFYTSGDRLGLLYKIKPNIPIMFLTMQGSFQPPKDIKDNVTGVYRTAHIKKAFETMNKIVLGIKNPVLIYKEKSGLDRSKNRYLKAAKKISLNLAAESYKSKKDLEDMFKRIQGKYDAIFTFPPSVAKPLIPHLIELQNKYKIPVISQVSKYVEQGLLAGSTADYEGISVKLVDYMESISNGKKPSDLPISYFSPNNVVNLKTSLAIDAKLNPSFVRQSRVVGLVSEFNIDKKEVSTRVKVPLKKGHFKIAISNDAPKKIVSPYLIKMTERGYSEGKNLEVSFYNRADKVNADLYFLTGNILKRDLPLLLDKKVVALQMMSNSFKQDYPTANIALVQRSSMTHLFNFIQLIGNGDIKKIKGLYHSSSQFPLVKNCPECQSLLVEKGIEVEFVSYTHDINQTLNQLVNSTDALFLLPFSIPRKDLNNLVKWQLKHKIPVIAQSIEDVNQGTLYGVSADKTLVLESLVELSDAILFKKIAPKHLNVRYLKSQYMINLGMANKMNIDLPGKVAEQMKVVITN